MTRQLLVILAIAAVLIAGTYGYIAYQRGPDVAVVPTPATPVPVDAAAPAGQPAAAPQASAPAPEPQPATVTAYQDPCQMTLQTLDAGLSSDPQAVFNGLIGRIQHIGPFPPQDDILKQVFMDECAEREAMMIREYLRTPEHVKVLQNAVVDRVGQWQIDFTSRLVLKAAADDSTGIGQRFLALRLREGGQSLAQAWRDFAVAVNAALERKEQAVVGTAQVGTAQ